MATADVARLARALATTPSRRALAALSLGGGVAALAGPGNAEAKKKCRKKKKKCPPPPTPPFCTGKNSCFAGEVECDSTGFCFCFLAAETGAPFCGHVPGGLTDVASCTECEADTTCIFAATGCSITGQPFACVPPCPNPF